PLLQSDVDFGGNLTGMGASVSPRWFDGLVPKPRNDRGQHRVITPQIAEQIERLKREDPYRSGAALVRELTLSSGQDSLGMSASTLYRFLKQRGLTTQELPPGTPLQPLRNRWLIKLAMRENS